MKLLPVVKYLVEGNSMKPTLKSGETVFVRKYFLTETPRHNDIIACKSPADSRTLIKRIVKVKDNEYFVEGDNKEMSSDSRLFGPIKKTDIIGKVFHIL